MQWYLKYRHQLCPHSHLFVEENIDNRVDNSAELGQDGRNHTSDGSHQLRPTKGGHQCHDAVGHPAQHVAGHHRENHQRNVVFSALSCQKIDLSHLEMWERRRIRGIDVKTPENSCVLLRISKNFRLVSGALIGFSCLLHMLFYFSPNTFYFVWFICLQKLSINWLLKSTLRAAACSI